MEAITTSTARSRAFFYTRTRGAGCTRWGGFRTPYAHRGALFPGKDSCFLTLPDIVGKDTSLLSSLPRSRSQCVCDSPRSGLCSWFLSPTRRGRGRHPRSEMNMNLNPRGGRWSVAAAAEETAAAEAVRGLQTWWDWTGQAGRLSSSRSPPSPCALRPKPPSPGQ